MLKFWKTEAAESLLYADTEIASVSEQGGSITVTGTGYDDRPITVDLLDAKVIANQIGTGERVETGQIVRLRNGAKRLFLFDDDDVLFLEVDYRDSRTI